MMRCSGPSRRYSLRLPAANTMFAWVIITPFGLPVLPDV